MEDVYMVFKGAVIVVMILWRILLNYTIFNADDIEQTTEELAKELWKRHGAKITFKYEYT